MCLTCGEHVTERLWYLEPEKHRIRSLGLLRDMIGNNIDTVVIAGLHLIRRRQPYGPDRLGRVSQGLLDWFAKTVHGTQVLPDVDSAFQVIDRATELALVPCPCRQVIAPDLPPAWKCIGLNIAARVYFRHEARNPVRAISKEEARNLVSEWRGRGAFQSAGWLWAANVIWLCNCDEYCGTHRAHELTWGMVPSIVVSRLVQPALCQGCQECLRWCLRPGALTMGQDNRVHVDEALCRGCGLCIEHCPEGALGFVPREVFYDVLTRSVRPVPGGVVQL